MKRFFSIILIIMLCVSMAVPAYAVTSALKVPSINIPEITVNCKLPDGFWDKCFEECEVDTPVISTAKYVHKASYYGMNKYLEIRWNKIDNAENYDVLITKADGLTIEYSVKTNMVYDKQADCPKVYVDKTSTWTAATVQVRAVCDGTVSEWSDAVEIGCDMPH